MCMLCWNCLHEGNIFSFEVEEVILFWWICIWRFSSRPFLCLKVFLAMSWQNFLNLNFIPCSFFSPARGALEEDQLGTLLLFPARPAGPGQTRPLVDIKNHGFPAVSAMDARVVAGEGFS